MTFQQKELFQLLYENSLDGLVVSDGKGNVSSCNRAFSKLIGKAEKQLVGESLSSLISFDAEAEGDHKHHDTTHNGDDSAEPFPAKPAHIFCRTGLELVMPVSQITMGTNLLSIVYIVQSSSVQQAQTEFVSTVSHELRTPLTSIKGFADTILRAGDRLDAAQQRRYVGIIKDQADRLTRLVEDLLAVSRLESKKMQLTIRAIDLNEAVQRVQRNLADKARDHRVIVNFPPVLSPVWADADRLEQILTNLIDNAIKYSPGKTTVTVTARDLPGTPTLVEFSVTDEGVGIPAEHLPQIFVKFSRLDNPLVRQTEGTGLGLYITRSLVLALGGQIKVTSQPGGTTFTVQLPAATLEEQAARGRG